MNNNDLDIRIKQLVHQNRYEKGFVDIVDILMQLNYLQTKDYELWKKGQVSYLEKVCQVNLSKLSLISKTIRKHATELKLSPSKTIRKHNQKLLQYCKSGSKLIEDSYATRFIDIKRINELKQT